MIAFHSSAENGLGRIAIDTGSGYRYAGQLGVTRLANGNFTIAVSRRIYDPKGEAA